MKRSRAFSAMMARALAKIGPDKSDIVSDLPSRPRRARSVRKVKAATVAQRPKITEQPAKASAIPAPLREEMLRHQWEHDGHEAEFRAWWNKTNRGVAARASHGGRNLLSNRAYLTAREDAFQRWRAKQQAGGRR